MSPCFNLKAKAYYNSPFNFSITRINEESTWWFGASIFHNRIQSTPTSHSRIANIWTLFYPFYGQIILFCCSFCSISIATKKIFPESRFFNVKETINGSSVMEFVYRVCHGSGRRSILSAAEDCFKNMYQRVSKHTPGPESAFFSCGGFGLEHPLLFSKKTCFDIGSSSNAYGSSWVSCTERWID